MNAAHTARRPRTRSPRALALAAALVLASAASVPSQAAASDWVFRRSYFSHEIPREAADIYPAPESRSAYRRAWTNTSPGFAVRGGYRINRITMRDGNSTDTTVIREDWFQVRP